MTDKLTHMRDLATKLSEASKAYYMQDKELMPNVEYDQLYDELVALEKETGTTLSYSPTINVGYEVMSDLVKENHELPMLSLDKTKSVEALSGFLDAKQGLLSLKLDGLTLVLTYDGGELVKALTRGDGVTGEVVTSNAKVFSNIPLKIHDQGKLIIRGEAVITYDDFEKINEEIGDADAKYKNPRNLASGSVRQLDSAVSAKRRLKFYAFSLAQSSDDLNSMQGELDMLDQLGFDTVKRKLVSADEVADAVEEFTIFTQNGNLPVDGLVLEYDDIAYGLSLGRTAKFPRNAIAFKWADENAQTELLDIEWSVSRTGLINPIAIFAPVALEGTTVSRASVHNVSIMKELKLGLHDIIMVYKANMIIPQISENLTQSGTCEPPAICPVCGGATEIKDLDGIQTLYCTNPDCQAKHIGAFSHFVSRAAMNIDGLSEQTIEKLIQHGFIHEFSDIYELEQHKDEISQMDGFGDKSYQNLIVSIDQSRKTTTARLLNALGIAGIGKANAKVISDYYGGQMSEIREAQVDELTSIDGVGPIMAESLYAYMHDEANAESLDRLLSKLDIAVKARRSQASSVAHDSSKDSIDVAITDSDNGNSDIDAHNGAFGKTFVITGSLENYENRDALTELIEELGGKVTGSVSKKTDYLINNDSESASSKNKKAHALGVKIITEAEFATLIHTITRRQDNNEH